MLKNYLIIAYRNMLKYKLYSTINIIGLAISLTCCGLIFLFVQDEFRFDRFHTNSEQIYRVIRETRMKDGVREFAQGGTSGAVVPALLNDFPEIKQAVRVWDYIGVRINHDGKRFIQRLCVADKNILDVFTFPLVKGDPKTVLQEPLSIVITETVAKNRFGDEDPIGKVFTIESPNFKGDYRITGILKDIDNSVIRFDMLTTTITSPISQNYWNSWLPYNRIRKLKSYVLLPKGYDPEELESKLPEFMSRYMDKEICESSTYHLQPLTRIYLYSELDYGMKIVGSMALGSAVHVYMLSAIAGFILLVACINFVNLATARSVNRVKEVGLRKVVGAKRMQLIFQFLGESFLHSLLATSMAILLLALVLPEFNTLVGKKLLFQMDSFSSVFMKGLVISVVVGLLAGSYPAIFLSNLQPIKMLKGLTKTGVSGILFRKGLIVFQFVISGFMIIGALSVQKQLNYIQKKDLGFDKEHIVVLDVFAKNALLKEKYESVKYEFLKHPNVLKSTATHEFMGWFNPYPPSVVRTEDVSNAEWRMHKVAVDEDFLDMFDIELVAGRNFSGEIASDATHSFILNETAVKLLGWKEPIGKQFEWVEGNRKGSVIGVVKDFHVESLHKKIGPLFIYKDSEAFYWLSLKISGHNLSNTLEFLEATWKRFIPNEPFRFQFPDATLARMYRSETRMNNIVNILAGLATFIACLGLFGLSSFSVVHRIKEIGVRKVLGASTINIVSLVSKEFLLLVMIASLIVWPLAYYAVEKWLQNFAYRIYLGLEIFVLAGIFVVVTALATVSYNAIRASTVNPIDVLRHE